MAQEVNLNFNTENVMKKLLMLLIAFGLVFGITAVMAGDKGPANITAVERCKNFLENNPDQEMFKNQGDCVSFIRGGNDAQAQCAEWRELYPVRYELNFGGGLGQCIQFLTAD